MPNTRKLFFFFAGLFDSRKKLKDQTKKKISILKVGGSKSFTWSLTISYNRVLQRKLRPVALGIEERCYEIYPGHEVLILVISKNTIIRGLIWKIKKLTTVKRKKD